MTDRRPPGVSFESWIDAQIRVARENGAFDNLPVAGQPLPDAGQPFDTVIEGPPSRIAPLYAERVVSRRRLARTART